MLELNRGREGRKEGLKIITGVSVIRRKNRMRARRNKNKGGVVTNWQRLWSRHVVSW